tara:strand:+ start:2162 stop:2767 length:606 start_codon:yes stop_codon:yes gene_type:complete
MSILIDNFLNFLFYLDTGWGVLTFVCFYIISVLLILPASWLSLMAGFLYGPYLGSFIVFISAFIGASISFFLAKEYLVKKIILIINRFPKIKLLEKIINKGGLKLIILTRLSPLFPFSILNYFYGLNKVTYKDFSIGLLFILPGTYLYCALGSLSNNLDEIKNLRLNSNTITTIVSIVSTFLIVYFLSKYSNEVIKESSEN